MESMILCAFSCPISTLCISPLVHRGIRSIYYGAMPTLIVLDDVSQMITTAIVSFSYAHRIMCKVDIAVVAEECVVVSSLSFNTWDGRYVYFGIFYVACLLSGWISRDADGIERYGTMYGERKSIVGSRWTIIMESYSPFWFSSAWDVQYGLAALVDAL